MESSNLIPHPVSFFAEIKEKILSNTCFTKVFFLSIYKEKQKIRYNFCSLDQFKQKNLGTVLSMEV